MIKLKRLGLALFIVLPFLGTAQDTLTTYYNSDWAVIEDSSEALYYRKLYQVSTDTWQAKDFFIEGNIQMVGQFMSAKTEKRKGVFTYYYKNGQISSTGLFVDDMEEGDWFYYRKNGAPSKQTTFDSGNCIVEKKWDMKGVATSGKCVLDFSEVNPEYVGGPEAMGAFIREEFTYPERSREMGEQGTVFVEFVIEKDGSISNVKTVKGVSKLLDAEAERVIKAMPKWIPGEQDGEPVNVRFTIPFKCSLGKKSKKKSFLRR